VAHLVGALFPHERVNCACICYRFFLDHSGSRTVYGSFLERTTGNGTEKTRELHLTEMEDDHILLALVRRPQLR
jgi:hypothetical protein